MFVPESWPRVIFDPSFPYRFEHMTLAAYLATAVLVDAFHALHPLRAYGDTRSQKLRF